MQDSPIGQLQNIPNFGAPTLQGFDVNSLGEGRPLRGISRQAVKFFPLTFTQVVATEVKIRDLPNGQTTTQVLKTGTKQVTREMVEVVTPGDKNVHCDFADDYHRRVFFKQYQAFRDGRTAPMGTSVEDCSFIAPQIATELIYRRVHTVEQLADASEVLCGVIPDGQNLREFARAHVKAARENSSAPQVNLLRAELEQSHSLILDMQKQLQELKAAQENAVVLGSDGQPTERKVRGKKEEI